MASNTASEVENNNENTVDEETRKRILKQLGYNLNDLDELRQKEAKIRILVTGANGVGKSTIINGLVGKRIFDTKLDELDHITTHVTEQKCREKGVEIIVFDCPASLDMDEEELLKLIEVHNGLDLILYCKEMSATDAKIEAEMEIIKKLTACLGKLTTKGSDKKMGKDIWHHCLFVLTFANVYEKCLEQRGEQDVYEQFMKRIDEWKSFFRTAQDRCGIHVPVNVCVCGNVDQELCETEIHWVSDLWAAAIERTQHTESAVLALLLLNLHRMVNPKTNETATSESQSSDSKTSKPPEPKPPEDQPIIPTEKVKTVFGLPLAGVGVAGAAGAASTATGATIGATIGALAIGVISFGPAAGAGLVIGGVIGAAIGSAVGGGILKAWKKRQRKQRKAKKREKVQ